MDSLRGLPLLSGPVPHEDSGHANSCRRCNKEFNVLFARSRHCNHCGYLYCHACTDFTALMPRIESYSPGHDQMPVCAFCVELLNVTASSRSQLKALPLSKLRKYKDAYGIQVVENVVEKDHLVDILIAIRDGNGCLPRANEEYYRKYSVPAFQGERIRSRGFFSPRSNHQPPAPHQPPNAPSANRTRFPRPDLNPEPPHTTYAPPPGPPPPPPHRSRPSPGHPPQVPPRPTGHSTRSEGSVPQPPPHSVPHHHYAQPHPPYSQYPSSQPPPAPPRPHSSNGPSPPRRSPSPYGHSPPNAAARDARPESSDMSTPSPRRPSSTSAAVPSLDELLEMSPDSITNLPVKSLKAILFRNHVNAVYIVEKHDLVEKVQSLIGAERSDREREAEDRRREEEEVLRQQHALLEEHEQRMREQNQTGSEPQEKDVDKDSAKPVAAAAAAAVPQIVERRGLCVICQDDEANIAIVDCGHLALCRDCSDLVMSTTRECPLCRTRIVTEARLLRIFKS